MLVVGVADASFFRVLDLDSVDSDWCSVSVGAVSAELAMIQLQQLSYLNCWSLVIGSGTAHL